MTASRDRRKASAAVAALAAVLSLLGTPAAAWAHPRVFVGGAVALGPYPYPYSYYPYWAYPPAYAWVEAPPPPAWTPGHWERRYDPWGRPIRVWVPAHLR